MRFDEGSYALDLIKIIALSGEFPFASLYLLGKNEEMYKRTIRTMKSKGYLTVSGSSDLKTVRITRKSFDVIKERLGDEYLKHYLEVSENHKFRGGESGQRQTWRKHRIAEVMCILRDANITLWKEEKPEISIKKSQVLDMDKAIFYDSREIKNSDPAQAKKSSFTRVIGLILSKGGYYCIYNANSGLMKWNSQGEKRAQVLVEDIVRYNTGTIELNYSADDAIIFGKDMSLSFDILDSDGSAPDTLNYRRMSFDNTFSNLHFITLDENGVEQIKLITSKNWKRGILKLFKRSEVENNTSSIDCDVTQDDGTHILTMFDGNLGRLVRFKQAVELRLGNKKYRILCFDWQKESIKKYINDDDVEIETIDMDIIKSLVL